MQVYYLEIVTREVDAVCAALLLPAVPLRGRETGIYTP